ncbi:hypothetical protein F2P56_021684, partial [Juglans regia]
TTSLLFLVLFCWCLLFWWAPLFFLLTSLPNPTNYVSLFHSTSNKAKALQRRLLSLSFSQQFLSSTWSQLETSLLTQQISEGERSFSSLGLDSDDQIVGVISS